MDAIILEERLFSFTPTLQEEALHNPDFARSSRIERARELRAAARRIKDDPAVRQSLLDQADKLDEEVRQITEFANARSLRRLNGQGSFSR